MRATICLLLLMALAALTYYIVEGDTDPALSGEAFELYFGARR